MPIDLRLMYVTDHQISEESVFLNILQQALAGGASVIQLREKHLNGHALYKRALACKQLCDAFEVPLLINDRVDIALAVDAAGVHLGQNDLPIKSARELLGQDKVIGLSVSSFPEATAKNTALADYLGISPLYSTTTKTENLESPLGLTGLAEIRKYSSLPLVSIGGINATNAQQAFAHGTNGIAVVSAISRVPAPKQSTQRLKQLCQTGFQK